MNLNAPTKNIWLVAVIVGILGVISNFVAIPFVSLHTFWFVTVGFAVLALASVVKGM